MIKGLSLAALLTVSLAVPALAQTPYQGVVPVPPVIADAEGAKPLGMIGGLSVWSIPGSEALFIAAPDGKTSFVGFAFDEAGKDIGYQLSGGTPLDLNQVLARQADIEANALLNAEGSVEAGTNETPAIDPHFLPFKQALEAATTEEEFKAVLEAWGRDLVGQVSNAEAVSSSEQASLLPLGNQNEVEAIAASDPASAANHAQVEEPETAEPAATIDDLLQQVRSDAFWFDVGSPEAPTVYAFIDPACPYCARSMAALQDDVEGGKLRLRVMLSPFLSDKSLDYTAAILLSQDPEMPAPVAFWKHELDYLYGSTSLPEVAPAQLPASLIDGLDANRKLMREAGIPGVPFFLWEDEAGAQHHFGVPEAGQFNRAVVEPVNQ
jgi:hypothetical protein